VGVGWLHKPACAGCLSCCLRWERGRGEAQGGRGGCDGVTDTDYVRMKGVVGHEYFLNWTGGCWGVVESFERPGRWVPWFCEGRGAPSARWSILGRHRLQDTSTSVNGRVGAERWQQPTSCTSPMSRCYCSPLLPSSSQAYAWHPLAWLRPSAACRLLCRHCESASVAEPQASLLRLSNYDVPPGLQATV
jgi:hypothetical protein